MCRIAGFIDFNLNNSYSLEETITLMRDTLIHGEPDDKGIFFRLKKL
jgi:asparagine synthase (glutamine-hydrolysing)